MSDPSSTAEPISHPQAVVDYDLIIFNNGSKAAKKDGQNVYAYRLGDPVYMDPSQKAYWIEAMQILARSLRARLSVFLKADVDLSVLDLNIKQAQDFQGSSPSVYFVTLFRLGSFDEICFLNMDVGLSMALIDRLLGGKGSEPQAIRALTKIECSIIQDVVKIILDEWAKIWSYTPNLKLDIIGNEAVPCFFNDPSATAPLVGMTLEVQFMNGKKNIDFFLPFPLFQMLSQHQHVPQKPHPVAASAESYSLFCEDMKLLATARWRPFNFKVADFLTLRKGDIIALPPDIINQTEFCFGGRAHFQGEIGLEDHQVVMQLNKPIYSEN